MNQLNLYGFYLSIVQFFFVVVGTLIKCLFLKEIEKPIKIVHLRLRFTNKHIPRLPNGLATHLKALYKTWIAESNKYDLIGDKLQDCDKVFGRLNNRNKIAKRFEKSLIDFSTELIVESSIELDEKRLIQEQNYLKTICSKSNDPRIRLKCNQNRNLNLKIGKESESILLFN